LDGKTHLSLTKKIDIFFFRGLTNPKRYGLYENNGK